GPTAIRAELDAGDPATPGPGNPAYLPRAARWHDADARGRPGDRRLCLHRKRELAGRVVRHRIGIFRRFLARFERPIAELQAAQPLDADVAFPTREQQTRRVTLFGSQRFAILAVGDE